MRGRARTQMNSYEPLYIDYLIYFNRDQDYFECHEVLEELWLKCDRDSFYKGMLQIAVGLYHFRNGNLRGARMMLQSAVELLEPYPSITQGIELERIVKEVRELLEGLTNADSDSFPYRDLTIVIQDDVLIQAVSLRSQHVEPNIPQRRSPTRGRIYEEKMRALQQKQQ